MTIRTDRVLARCQGCGRAFRIADPDRRHECKSCGGEIHPLAHKGEGRKGTLSATVACPACDAVNRHGAHFCVECGVALGASPPLLLDQDVVDERRKATRELRHAYRWMDAVSWAYRLGAAGHVALVVASVVALASTDVPLGPGLVVVGLTSLVAVTMLMGAIQLLFRPFLWTLTIALLATLVAVAYAVGPNPLGLALPWSIGWAVLFWACLAPTLSLRRLIAEHTDLYITHHASRSTKRSLEGRSAKQQHARLLVAMARASRRAWKLSAVLATAVVVCAAAGSYLVVTQLRSELLPDAIAELEAAWASDGTGAVAAFYPSAAAGEAEARRLAGTLSGHGFEGRTPPLADRAEVELDDGVRVDYDLEGVPLSFYWRRDGQEWVVVELELPIAPFEPVLERFLDTWRGTDPAAIAGFFPPGYRADRRATLEELAERRGWTAALPDVAVDEIRENGLDERYVDLRIEDGLVKTGWLLRSDGTWALDRLDFPSPRRKKR